MNHLQIICLIAFALVNIFSYSNGQPPPPGLCTNSSSTICCPLSPNVQVRRPRLSKYTKCCGNSGITYESNTTTKCCGNITYLSSAKMCCKGTICIKNDFMCIKQFCRFYLEPSNLEPIN